MENPLVATLHGKPALAKSSQKSLMIAACLDLAASVMRTELTSGEVQFWRVTLEPFQIPAIQWAFQEFLRTGTFFPKPAEILGLVERWNAAENNRREIERKRLDEIETEARRARGETFGWDQVVKEFKEVFDKMIMPEAPRATVVKQGNREIRIPSERRQELKKQTEEIKHARGL